MVLATFAYKCGSVVSELKALNAKMSKTHDMDGRLGRLEGHRDAQA